MPFIVDTIALTSPLRRIRYEAERRIGTGITVNGKPFRCDEISTQRIGELVESFGDGLIGDDGVTFRTVAGDTFTLTSLSETRTIYDAQRRHRSALLTTSSALQAAPPDDPEADSHWPLPEQITL